MSRSEDAVIVRAEITALTEAQRRGLELIIKAGRPDSEAAPLGLADAIVVVRRTVNTVPGWLEYVRGAGCGCPGCTFARTIDDLGLLV